MVVEFRDIPPVLRNAIVAVEDADFWKHIGINPWRIPGAAFANLRSGRRGQGFSTLTMQLTRLLFLTPEKTYERKIKEVILAFQIEKNFTKEEILTLYCNQIYFGHGNYGVEAASRFYFGKSVKDLTLPEAALIAGIAQSPARLCPIEHPDRAPPSGATTSSTAWPRRSTSAARRRRRPSRRRSACTCARTRPRSPPTSSRRCASTSSGSTAASASTRAGLRVYTTLDPGMQRAAVRALRDGLRTLDRRARGFVKPETSLLANGLLPEPLHLDEWDWPFAAGDVVRGVVIASDRATAVVQIGDYRARLSPADVAWTRRTSVVRRPAPAGWWRPSASSRSPRPTVGRRRSSGSSRSRRSRAPSSPSTCASGAVRAMVGGYDFEKSKFNRATQAMRQVGSAFKPVVYAAALETLGWTPSTIIVDAPLSFPNPWNKTTWTPQNYDGAYMGPIPLRRAVEQSRNIPAVKTLQAVGVEKGIEYARKLGLAGELPPFLPIALGAGEATLLEMVGAYATFANQGLRMKPFLIERITDREGNAVEQATPRATDALRADTAFITDLAPARRRGAGHGGPGAPARAAHRGQDRHHERLHRRLVHRLRALARRRGVGRLRREEGLAGPRRDGGRRGPAHLDGLLGRGHRRSPRRGAPDPGQRRLRPRGRDGPARERPGRRACGWRPSWPAREPRPADRPCSGPEQ